MNPFFQILKKDHKEVKGILAQLTATQSGAVAKRDDLFRRLRVKLVPHMKAEESTFYPPLVAKAALRHDHLGGFLWRKYQPACGSLEQNYPNPFNPSTTIPFSVPRRMYVKLAIFNVLGQKVKELLSALQDPGFHEVVFNASQLSSGVYYCRMEVSDRVQTRTVILLR